MNKQIHHILDVTISYPKGNLLLIWGGNFLCRGFDSIKIHVRQLAIPAQFLNATSLEDNDIQQQFRQWLNQTWAEKDELLITMKVNYTSRVTLITLLLKV